MWNGNGSSEGGANIFVTTQHTDTEVAMQMWPLLLPLHFELADKWIKFAEVTLWQMLSVEDIVVCHTHTPVRFTHTQKQELKVVTKDVWDMILEFAYNVKPDLSDWEDDGAWYAPAGWFALRPFLLFPPYLIAAEL